MDILVMRIIFICYSNTWNQEIYLQSSRIVVEIYLKFKYLEQLVKLTKLFCIFTRKDSCIEISNLTQYWHVWYQSNYHRMYAKLATLSGFKVMIQSAKEILYVVKLIILLLKLSKEKLLLHNLIFGVLVSLPMNYWQENH